MTFDPATIGFQALALFIRAIDPLSVNRQGAVTHPVSYRRLLPSRAGAGLPRLLEGLSVRLGQPVAVEASPLDSFFPAEEYHQDYLEKHTDGYCHLPFSAFRQAAEAAVWPETPVWTVTGTVPAAALGKTVVCGQSFLSGTDASDSAKETLTVRGLAFFRMLRKSGYTGFLDAAPRGFSRELFLMEALSRETGCISSLLSIRSPGGGCPHSASVGGYADDSSAGRIPGDKYLPRVSEVRRTGEDHLQEPLSAGSGRPCAQRDRVARTGP